VIAQIPTTMSARAHHLTRPSLLFLLLFIVLFVPPGVACAQEEPADAPRGAGFIDRDGSLELGNIELDLAKARIRSDATSFLRRLIGTVRVTASMGVRDLLFVDHATALPYAFPNDAYRVSVSFSPDIFFGSDHDLAECDLRKVEISRESSQRLLEDQRRELVRKDSLLSHRKAMLLEELRIREDLAKFNALRFEQGKIRYDLLMRSHLELLGAKMTLEKLESEIGEIRATLARHRFQ